MATDNIELVEVFGLRPVLHHQATGECVALDGTARLEMADGREGHVLQPREERADWPFVCYAQNMLRYAEYRDEAGMRQVILDRKSQR